MGVAYEDVRQMLLSSAHDTIRAHERAGHVAHSVPAHPTDEELVIATVGFATGAERGSVTLLCPRRVVRRMQPGLGELGRDCTAAELRERDVLGELANMLSGRLKNHLHARGIAISITPPTTGISRTMLPHGELPFPTFQAILVGRDRFFVHLETSAEDKERDLPSDPPGDEEIGDAVLEEGELVLF